VVDVLELGGVLEYDVTGTVLNAEKEKLYIGFSLSKKKHPSWNFAILIISMENVVFCGFCLMIK
jgi:hypothetical protein